MAGAFVSQTLLGIYRVDSFVSNTPLGELYKVVDTREERYLAMIILPDAVSGDPDAAKVFESSVSALQKIRHPNLVNSLGLYRTANLAFLLEEWVDGPSLRDVLRTRAGQPVTHQEALCYAKALLEPLEHLHQQGWVHLALAPELIRFNRRGELRLGGVGGCVRSGSTAGLRPGYPALYAAPEQFTESPVSPASDEYALAVILFEALTGCWLNGRQNTTPRGPDGIRQAHLERDLPKLRELNPDLPELLARILPKGLSRSPKDRLPTVREYFLSLCMAARTQADTVPGRITSLWAPEAQAMLDFWSYSPPIVSSRIELDPAISQPVAAPPSPVRVRVQPGRWVGIGLSLLIGLGIFYLLWQIPVSTPGLLPVLPTDGLFQADSGTPLPTLTLAPTEIRLPTATSTHGYRIIYTCTRREYNQLCIINQDGTGAFRLTTQYAHDYYPSFLPQGGAIVFASNRTLGKFDLYLLVFDGLRYYRLTDQIGNVVSPDFSPDGEFVVFANRPDDGPTSIWVVDKNGLEPRQLYAGPKPIVGVAWSPDGKTIAFAMAVDQVNEYEIFLMDADGKNIRRLSHDLLGIGGSLDWSPDGANLLIYAGAPGDKDIFRLDAATGAATRLTFGGNNASASYSPDGQWIAFNSLRNEGQADIYLMRADGSDLKQLTNDPEPDWQPQWEP